MAKKLPPDPYFPDDEEEVTPEPEMVPQPEALEEKKSKKKHSTPDGPRYTVGLRSDTDPCCYKDFFETEVLSEAKEEAQKAVEKYSKGVIIWDRKGCTGIIERYESPKGEDPMVVGKVMPETKKKGVKRKQIV